jgi:hypothetical protein
VGLAGASDGDLAGRRLAPWAVRSLASACFRPRRPWYKPRVGPRSDRRPTSLRQDAAAPGRTESLCEASRVGEGKRGRAGSLPGAPSVRCPTAAIDSSSARRTGRQGRLWGVRRERPVAGNAALGAGGCASSGPAPRRRRAARRGSHGSTVSVLTGQPSWTRTHDLPPAARARADPSDSCVLSRCDRRFAAPEFLGRGPDLGGGVTAVDGGRGGGAARLGRSGGRRVGDPRWPVGSSLSESTVATLWDRW